MPPRPCLGCGQLTTSARCTRCTRQQYRDRDQHRPTTTQRGYGTDHTALRAAWKPHVDAGTVNCWRCSQPIKPATPWDLGHHDTDRTQHRGPEHRACNRATSGRTTH